MRPAYRAVCTMFEQQVDRTPDAVAVKCERRQLTYRELDERANQLAWFLRRHHGVGPETLVGLLLGRSERIPITMLAVLKAGGAYVPICPDYPANRIRYVLDDAAPNVVISERAHTDLLA